MFSTQNTDTPDKTTRPELAALEAQAEQLGLTLTWETQNPDRYHLVKGPSDWSYIGGMTLDEVTRFLRGEEI